VLAGLFFATGFGGFPSRRIHAQATSNTRHWASKDNNEQRIRIITDLSHDACYSKPACGKLRHSKLTSETSGLLANVGLISKILGHPLWGTHKKMNGSDEQEWREFMRLKHHSHAFKKQPLS
jgi:hypothetical protein